MRRWKVEGVQQRPPLCSPTSGISFCVGMALGTPVDTFQTPRMPLNFSHAYSHSTHGKVHLLVPSNGSNYPRRRGQSLAPRLVFYRDVHVRISSVERAGGEKHDRYILMASRVREGKKSSSEPILYSRAKGTCRAFRTPQTTNSSLNHV